MDKLCVNNNQEKRNTYKKKWRKDNPIKSKAIEMRRNLKRGQLPMNENKTCAAYLGVYVAENVLNKVFDNVMKQPYGNPGFDFICGKDKKIDVKSSCLRTNHGNKSLWCFSIAKNKIADYFLCLAFDNRKNLNPMHIWLIPSNEINYLVKASISISTLRKWLEYEKPIDKIITCCTNIKNATPQH